MAAGYNQEAVHQYFVPGDEVLVLLPVTGKPLETRYHGPYVVVKKVGDLNYVVTMELLTEEKTLSYAMLTY